MMKVPKTIKNLTEKCEILFKFLIAGCLGLIVFMLIYNQNIMIKEMQKDTHSIRVRVEYITQVIQEKAGDQEKSFVPEEDPEKEELIRKISSGNISFEEGKELIKKYKEKNNQSGGSK